MGFRPRIALGFWLTLAAPGCLMLPVGSYQAPNTLGKGNHQLGAAVTVAPEVHLDQGLLYFLGEANIWLDYGLLERGDLRTRLFVSRAFPTEIDAEFWLPGIELELKLPNRSETIALISGISSSLLLVKDEDPFWLISPWLGAVFGIGEPGGVRLLLTPRFAAGLTSLGIDLGFAASFSIGLDLPITKRLSLRPEATINCALFVWAQTIDSIWAIVETVYENKEQSACWAGLGTAVVF